MNRSFLKYIGCAFAVFAGVAVVDKVAGAGMDRLLDAVPVTQDIGKGRFAIREVETDVVIVGSSRAAHHYVSTMIADSLGCSVYNVGRDGRLFSDNLCVINSIIDRYSPKVILLAVSEDYIGTEALTRPEAMFPYYDESEYIKDLIVTDLGWRARLQMQSLLFRYNSISFKTIGYGISGLHENKMGDPNMGFVSFRPDEDKYPTEFHVNKKKINVSCEKYGLLKSLLLKAKDKDVHMILVLAPIYQKDLGDESVIVALKSLCQETGAEFWDYSREALFFEHPEWFRDWEHMNYEGAVHYTQIIIEQLRRLEFCSVAND